MASISNHLSYRLSSLHILSHSFTRPLSSLPSITSNPPISSLRSLGLPWLLTGRKRGIVSPRVGTLMPVGATNGPRPQTTLVPEKMESSVATRREYFDDMFKLQSKSTFLSTLKEEDGRLALVLDSTIFHPQGGGQPADHGYISGVYPEFEFKFVVNDVRSKDGDVILHYGFFEQPQPETESKLEKGQEVSLHVDKGRRELNARLHSAGHVLDVCLLDVGLSHLEAGRGYHFPDGPWVEYKGTIPKDQLEVKQKELEVQANKLISNGLKLCVSILSYEEASEMCGGSLPSYIPKGSNPRIVKLGDYPGCPCGGTHVANLADVKGMKVTNIRVKKGQTKIYYTVE